ncbi:MAG TPA: hypothetical protein VFF86_04645 [Candidatus Methylomirabilis sp.]|nr:hypothetical protein [Candidatus Methylomirabilis sp.]
MDILVKRLIASSLIALLALLGCSRATEEAPYSIVIDPTEFAAQITNSYFPLVPGTTLIYEGETSEGLERVEDYITHETREILGVTCIVVRNRVTLNGELVEETFDWYAQDRDGNVWYFGEEAKDYENGVVVSTKGSWEAGIDGALPGIIMQANPQVGDPYRQEFYAGEAEDMAQVLSITESVTVPHGSYDRVVRTMDWTPLEPGKVEDNFYASGIGLILEVIVEGGEGRVELIDILHE